MQKKEKPIGLKDFERFLVVSFFIKSKSNDDNIPYTIIQITIFLCKAKIYYRLQTKERPIGLKDFERFLVVSFFIESMSNDDIIFYIQLFK